VLLLLLVLPWPAVQLYQARDVAAEPACCLLLALPWLVQEDEQYREGKLRFTGGHGEQASYGAGERSVWPNDHQ
jgi:hypothetical protein